jgi:Tol biopolymer transport system component
VKRFFTLFFVALLLGPVLGQSATRVSQSTGGDPGNGASLRAAVSSDGRYVVFQSVAGNLVAGDSNGVMDIFLADRQENTLVRISVRTDGTQANDDCVGPVISADGRWIAYVSRTNRLVSSDENREMDVFLYDRLNQTTEIISRTASGGQANRASMQPALSADGRYVAFQSLAGNLVAGDDNGAWDIFVRDRQTGTTQRVSVSTGGGQADGSSFNPAISADGRYVAFQSEAANLVPGDANGCWDVFVHDRQTGETRRVSLSWDGAEIPGDSTAPAISADGRHVAFASRAESVVAGDTNLDMDVFVTDWQSGLVERVSVAGDGQEALGDSMAPALSNDGRWVAFQSWANNLAAQDANDAWDVFVRDRETGWLFCASLTTDGAPASRDSVAPALAGDGQLVVFHSLAGDLVAGDTNSSADIFLTLVPADWLPGDLNHDGRIDALDIQILAAYLAGNIDLPPGTTLAEADLTPDGLVNIMDLLALIRQII